MHMSKDTTAVQALHKRLDREFSPDAQDKIEWFEDRNTEEAYIWTFKADGILWLLAYDYQTKRTRAARAS